MALSVLPPAPALIFCLIFTNLYCRWNLSRWCFKHLTRLVSNNSNLVSHWNGMHLGWEILFIKFQHFLLHTLGPTSFVGIALDVVDVRSWGRRRRRRPRFVQSGDKQQTTNLLKPPVSWKQWIQSCERMMNNKAFKKIFPWGFLHLFEQEYFYYYIWKFFILEIERNCPNWQYWEYSKWFRWSGHEILFSGMS